MRHKAEPMKLELYHLVKGRTLALKAAIPLSLIEEGLGVAIYGEGCRRAQASRHFSYYLRRVYAFRECFSIVLVVLGVIVIFVRDCLGR